MEVAVFVGAMRPEVGYIHSSRAETMKTGTTFRQLLDSSANPKPGISVTQTIAVGPAAEGFCAGEHKAKLKWEKHIHGRVFPRDESAEVQEARLAQERKVRLIASVVSILL